MFIGILHATPLGGSVNASTVIVEAEKITLSSCCCIEDGGHTINVNRTQRGVFFNLTLVAEDG